ncbi:uncharacterized protein C5orf34 homolog isoform X1 [Hoplias malabaricus]|uniref:uncharacterized protein C5orf34 homolog isoform X1 n=2 Tax=Hoplias malabaricus TaxID=27720 RepID=UPI003462E3DB
MSCGVHIKIFLLILTAMACVRFMVMYDDESVDVSFVDGSRLQLSPCGSEYILERPPAHPLQKRERERHRTRFTISQYRTLVAVALNFRNKYATQPYLPEEILPDEQKEKRVTELLEVEWPATDSYSVLQRSVDGETVSSVDGNACLRLSSCGEDFEVEFLSSCSRSKGPFQNKKTELEKQKYSPSKAAEHLQPSENVKDENKGTGRIVKTYSRVIQHHSCLETPHMWTHPLSLALSQREARITQHSNAIGQKNEAEKERESDQTLKPLTRAKSVLPLPLPLTCPHPHLHSWRYGSGASDWSELGVFSELVKVVWCQGIIYRVLGGTVPVVEVSPADGTVIRSNGVLAEYYTHYKTTSSTTLESVYYLNGLPPDLPGQPYSIRNVVTRASRILQCYKEARSCTTPNMLQCCWRRVEVRECVNVISEVQVTGTGHFFAFSDGSAHITFLNGVQVQTQWNTDTSAEEHVSVGTEPLSKGAGLYQLTLPNGQKHLLQEERDGVYHRYVTVVREWCNWVKKNVLTTGDLSAPAQPCSDQPVDSRCVLAELQKIRRFHFLLDNNPVLTSHSDQLQRLTQTSNLSVLTITNSTVTEALQKTTKTIQDINALLTQKPRTPSTT